MEPTRLTRFLASKQLTLCVPNFADCKEERIDYDVPKDAVLKPHIPNLTNATECQRACQEKDECKSFTFNNVGKACWLKRTGNVKKVPHKDGTSGPKYCVSRIKELSDFCVQNYMDGKCFSSEPHICG